jgi:hypothetical protein
LSDPLALLGVGIKELRSGDAAQDGAELPTQVKRVRHRDVHPLAGLRAVGVAGVAGDEHPGEAPARLLDTDVVELVAQALTDLID